MLDCAVGSSGLGGSKRITAMLHPYPESDSKATSMCTVPKGRWPIGKVPGLTHESLCLGNQTGVFPIAADPDRLLTSAGLRGPPRRFRAPQEALQRPEKEALVFQSGDAADLSRKLEKLLSERSVRDAFGQSARERGGTYLTIERCAAEYDLVYDHVLSPPN